MVDIRQSPKYAKYLSQIGWIVETMGGTNYFIKKIPLLGSVIKLQRPEEIKNANITKLMKKYRAFQIIVEPKTKLDAKYLTSSGYKLLKTPYLPSKTLLLDLTKSKSGIVDQFKKDCKSVITKNVNLKTTNYESKDISLFREKWEKAIQGKRHIPPVKELKILKKTFGNNSLFITTKDIKGTISGAAFLKSNQMGYYWHGFSDIDARKIKAQYKIVWEGILWAKTNGIKLFDFEGIYDPRFPNPKWKGFTHFKKSFGGEEKEFPGAYSKFFLPAF
ncbi:peptidoglycan bridge formation glycyltransferase FemA/FemB family protein [Patescibacteria group bacterium]